MSTNPNTKTYWRRVSRMARELAFKLSLGYDDKSVTDIIAAVDPGATRTMHREAIKMAIEDCTESERRYKKMADRYRMGAVALRDFRGPISLRVIDGGNRKRTSPPGGARGTPKQRGERL